MISEEERKKIGEDPLFGNWKGKLKKIKSLKCPVCYTKTKNFQPVLEVNGTTDITKYRIFNNRPRLTLYPPCHLQVTCKKCRSISTIKVNEPIVIPSEPIIINYEDLPICNNDIPIS